MQTPQKRARAGSRLTRRPAKTNKPSLIKQWKRRQFMRKAKFTLTVTLPVFLTLLSIKVIKTYVKIKVRSLFTHVEPDSGSKQSAGVKTDTHKTGVSPAPSLQQSAGAKTDAHKTGVSPAPSLQQSAGAKTDAHKEGAGPDPCSQKSTGSKPAPTPVPAQMARVDLEPAPCVSVSTPLKDGSE